MEKPFYISNFEFKCPKEKYNIGLIHIYISKLFSEKNDNEKSIKDRKYLFDIRKPKEIGGILYINGVVRSSIKPYKTKSVIENICKISEINIDNMSQEKISIYNNKIISFRVFANIMKDRNGRKVMVSDNEKKMKFISKMSECCKIIDIIQSKNEIYKFKRPNSKIKDNIYVERTCFLVNAKIIDDVKFMDMMENGVGRSKSYACGLIHLIG